MKRSAWARRADRVATWLGVDGKGTTRSGRSRIPYPFAIVDSRTTLRSSSFRAAEETRSDAKFNGRPWVHLHFSRRNPGLVSIIVDEKLAAVILKFLAWRWKPSPKGFPLPATYSERFPSDTPK